MGLFSALFGDSNTKQVKQLEKMAERIDGLDASYQSKTDDELIATTATLKQRLADGETLDDILYDAFAVVRETGKRVLSMKHFFVQLEGGIALHQGRIAEMTTGEGKTLVSTLPAYLNALSGNGVHIVTVNEYLAKRDAEWMGKIFKFLGLSVGVITAKMSTREKQKAYNCDITYGTNNEFGFDYLRDNMAVSKEGTVQRPLNFAIIDEVDSILIDEARTPLIISGMGNQSSGMYVTANRFAKTLVKTVDFEHDEKDKAASLTDEGMRKAEEFFKIDNLSDIDNTELNHYILNALKAHALMKRDSDYIVEGGEVVIVDEFTGRKMEGRRFSAGLHQAIEAKENVRVKEENKTLATVTFQNFFRLYKKLSGMTGTAKTEEGEFNSIYNLDVVQIPTNKTLIRIDYDDVLYSTRAGKLRAIVEDISQRYLSGQPMLIGTITVEKSEELSKMLSLKKIPHNVLNAKNHEREAEIVAQAGRYKGVTIATNMAGRGTDILLGGNPEYLAKQQMLKEGYTDEQLLLATSYKEGDEEIEKLKAVYKDLYTKYKVDTDKEKEKVVALGGLHILGTERHESRRIDNQLRGRAGRQGDPGSSVFFISLEDDLARIFGGEKVQSAFNLFKVDEDTPIAARILTNQIENAQNRIEGQNFSSRKYVLQYDDVMNVQRNLIYSERQKVLNGEDIHKDILDMVDAVCVYVIKQLSCYKEPVKEWDLVELNTLFQKELLPIGEELVTAEILEDANVASITKLLKNRVTELLTEKAENDDDENNEINFHEVERFILLKVVDQKWMDHIDSMDQMRKGVGLMAIGNHDPVVVYKNQGFDMFETMEFEIKYDTIRLCLKANITRLPQRAEQEIDPKEANPNLSRNKLCPCGSGKKYKHCCGKGVE